jgi:hypothetical protein
MNAQPTVHPTDEILHALGPEKVPGTIDFPILCAL